jgi:hypothetical protein
MYSDSTPSHSSADHETAVDWTVLIAQFIHPLKVQIIETMRWLGEPMSAVKLKAVFDKDICLSNISYHVDSLAKLGVLELVETNRVRGAHEHFYFFTSLVMDDSGTR